MNLTQTAALTKRLLLFLVLLVIVGFSAWVGYRFYYYNVYLPSLPPPEEEADPKFGKLPSLLFPVSTASATNFQYILDTPTGDLPAKLPKIMKVFFVPQRSVSLLDPDRQTNLANELGFPFGPDVITPTQYKYTDSEGGELMVDLDSGNLKFKRVFDSATSESVKVGTLAPADKLESDFVFYLENKGLMKPQLEKGRTKAIYINGYLKNSSSATVSLWPADIDKYSIVTPLFNSSLVREVVQSGKTEKDRIISLNFVYYEVDQKTFATYPIKSALNAFNDLKAGAGVIILAPISGQVSLRDIYLAYYQPEVYAPYLQPVFVFEGEDFAAYIPAIISDYTE